MAAFEYRVIPAPTKGKKGKGLRTPEAKFANAVEQLINDLAAEGWEYQRTDALPATERQGLTGSTTEWRNLLVFRRALESQDQVSASPRVAPVRRGIFPTIVANEPQLQSDYEMDYDEVIAQHTSQDDLDRFDDPADFEDPPEDMGEPVKPPLKPVPSADLEPQLGGAVRMLRDNGVEEVSDVSGVTTSLASLAYLRSAGKKGDG